MSQLSKSGTLIFFGLFGLSLAIALSLWILRGLQIIQLMTSGVIWILLLLSIGLAVMSLFATTKRY